MTNASGQCVHEISFTVEWNILQIFHPKLHATKQKFPTVSSSPANRNFQFQNMKITKIQKWLSKNFKTFLLVSPPPKNKEKNTFFCFNPGKFLFNLKAKMFVLSPGKLNRTNKKKI